MRTLSAGAAIVAHALLNTFCASVYAQQPNARVFFVFFAGGSVEVPPQFEADLKEASCNVGPGIAVKIRGYADRAGAPNDNLVLSERRAVNVLNAIGRYGVPCDRLRDFKGLGEQSTPGETENEPFSRRVEVIFKGTPPSSETIASCKAAQPPNPPPPGCVAPK